MRWPRRGNGRPLGGRESGGGWRSERQRATEVATAVLSEMGPGAVEPNEVCRNTVLGGLVRSERWALAQEVVRRASDTVAVNVLLGTVGWQEALALLERMEEQSLRATIVTLNAGHSDVRDLDGAVKQMMPP